MNASAYRVRPAYLNDQLHRSDYDGLDPGDAAESDGLGRGDTTDGDGLAAGEVASVGEPLVRCG